MPADGAVVAFGNEVAADVAIYIEVLIQDIVGTKTKYALVVFQEFPVQPSVPDNGVVVGGEGICLLPELKLQSEPISSFQGSVIRVSARGVKVQ